MVENNFVYGIILEVYKKLVCDVLIMVVYRNIINWKGRIVIRSIIMDLFLFYFKECEELEFNLNLLNWKLVWLYCFYLWWVFC